MTRGYGGHQIIKRITVQTDDSEHLRLQLVVKGKVNKFVTMRPARVRLDGALGTVIKQNVTIVPEKAYPFKIIGTTVKPGGHIKTALEEKMGENGPEYVLDVENTYQKVGRYFETVVLKTDNKIRPTLEVRVYGNIMENKPRTPPATEKPAVKSAPTGENGGGVSIKVSKEAKTQ